MTNGAAGQAYDVVILGAGYAGLMAAFRLNRRKAPARIALVSERPHFLERVRLQESVSAPVEPRLPPLAALLAGAGIEFIRGRVVTLDAEGRRVRIDEAGVVRELDFARAIYALGSATDVAAVPGVADHAYRLDPGEGPLAAALRARLETWPGGAARVLVVGGGNTATEVAGEIKTTWPHAEVTMVSHRTCGDFDKGERITRLTREALHGLGVRLRDGERIVELRQNEAVTASGAALPFDVCVWSGGLRAAGVAAAAGIATDPQERIWVDPELRSVSHPAVIAVGDAAHPLAPTGARYRLSAFAALVTGAYAADAILAEREGRAIRPFSFSTFGQGVAIGRAGVGFTTYPDDRRGYFVLTGRLAYRVRNLFVWMLLFLLRMELRHPGSFFWPGRRRISRQRAEEAMRIAAVTAR